MTPAGQPPGDGDEWAPLGELAALADGALHAVYVAGHPLVVVAVDGQVYAVDGRCPHRGELLEEGRRVGDAVRCPYHGFRYRLCDGENTWPGGWEPLATYDTRVSGDTVFVRRAWRQRR